MANNRSGGGAGSRAISGHWFAAHMSTSTAIAPLRLEPISGPAIAPIAVPANKQAVLGRASVADIRLLDETVSRRHAQIFARADTWLITDLESRHGTLVNGVPLTPNTAAPLQHGDVVTIGPWNFRVLTTGVAGPATSMVMMQDDAGGAANRVQRVPQSELSLRAQARLDLLIESAAAIAAAATEATLAATVLDALVKGTGFPRAAFIRAMGAGDEVELVAFKAPADPPSTDASGFPTNFSATGTAGGGAPAAGGRFAPSRSLIRAAGEGQVVRLDAGSSSNYGQSIIDLGIHSAICAPVMNPATGQHGPTPPIAYLYLDSRGTEVPVAPDAAAFCQAISRITGLALSNINRAALEERQKVLEGELLAARAAQQLIMPPSAGAHGPLTYAMHSEPGRIVAGDLFDIIRLEPDRELGKVAILLGDVSGKGVSAALLMATAQAFLNAFLRQNPDPAAALAACNAHIVAHAQGTRFISLWLGVFDPDPASPTGHTVHFVDAGHGYWLYRPPGQSPDRVECVGGVPLGVTEDAPYVTESLAFPPGSRLIVYSDGVHEQPSPDGDEFGLERTLAALSSAADAEADVVALLQSVKAHAAPALFSSSTAVARPFAAPVQVNLADDVTVASIAIA